MVGAGNEVMREKFLGESKLDFLVGNTYLEVKTPLQHLQINIPEWVKTKKTTPFSSTDRMQRHISELAKSLQEHERAIFLLCFIYDNPGFQVIGRSANYEEVRETVENSVSKGVELWQANFSITPKAVALKKCFPLHMK